MKSTVVHQMPICDLFPIPFLSDHTPQFCKNFPSYIQEVTVTLFYGLFLNAGFHNLKGKSEGLGISAFQRCPEGRPDEVHVATVGLRP